MAVQALGVLQGQQRGLWCGLHCGPLAHSQVHGLGLRACCIWLEGRAAWGDTAAESGGRPVCRNMVTDDWILWGQLNISQNPLREPLPRFGQSASYR